MTQKIVPLIIIGFLLTSCKEKSDNVITTKNTEESKWDIQGLEDRASQHLDKHNWNLKLFQQDIETYNKYADVFQSYPLNKSPFPVADYDYAVASSPFIIEQDSIIFKGIRIGEYESPESEKIIDKLTLIVLTNDKEAEETTLVDSRNFPYLTAQGIFKVTNNELDWVFSSSPDGFSTLLINMKLFDLRFGETIVIFPQTDKSFFYEQIKDTPNNYKKFENYKSAIMNQQKVKTQLNSEMNIK